MRDLSKQISAQLLPRVRRPGQYTGLEINARHKDPLAAQVRVAMAFPDTYAIGISHLGSQILYQMVNDLPNAACDRAYCPEPDAEAVMREFDIPLFGWESRCALADFDVIGFSLPYELCLTNVLTMLDLAGVPIHSADRTESDPIIIAGDALAETPEPMAAFVDMFLIGEGEISVPALVELIARAKATGLSRSDILIEAARTIPGAYVPALYEPQYDADGHFCGLNPTRDDIPTTIERAQIASMADSPAIEAPLVPLSEGVHERVVIEIMRGCPNACRFCQAGATRGKVRTRSVDEIVEIARKAIAATGFDEIGLLSLSTSDYPHLGELIGKLDAEFTDKRVSVSLPSLRAGQQLRHLPQLTSSVRKGGLTIAAEAGTDALRDAIGKNITEADMLAGVRAAYEAGWRRVKVYFLGGLPGETDEDIDAIFALCKKLSDTGKEITGHPGSISASVSWLVPKPHTAMQYCGMRTADYYFAMKDRLRELARRSAVNFKFHWIERSLLEGMIARGDRRVGEAIEAAWTNGARLDAWNEHFDYDNWLAAFEETGIDLVWYANRQIATDEPTPWSHISCPPGPQITLREYNKMLDALDVSR